MIASAYACTGMTWLRLALLCACLSLVPSVASAHGGAHEHHEPQATDQQTEHKAATSDTYALEAPSPCPNGGGACCCAHDCCSGFSPARVAAPSWSVVALPQVIATAPRPRAAPASARALLLTASIGAR